MAGYQWSGALQRANLINLSFPKFNVDWAANQSTLFLNHIGTGILLIILLTFLGTAVKISKHSNENRRSLFVRAIAPLAFFITLNVGFAWLADAEIKRQLMIWSFYLYVLLSFVGIYGTRPVEVESISKSYSYLLAPMGLSVLLFSALTYFLSGIPVPIKVPSVHVLTDSMALALISIIICMDTEPKIYFKFISAGFFCVMIALYDTPPSRGFFSIPSSENNYVPVNVTPLRNHDSSENRFVDAERFFVANCADLPIAAGSANFDRACIDYRDAYSAILGARIHFSTSHQQFMNFNFINLNQIDSVPESQKNL